MATSEKSVQTTISAALRRIKKLKGTIGAVSERMKLANIWKDDKSPAESFGALFTQRANLVAELTSIQDAVNKANVGTLSVVLSDEKSETMSALYAVRTLQEIRGLLSLLGEVPSRVREREEEVTPVLGFGVDGGRVREERKTVHHCALVETKKLALGESLSETHDAINAALEAFNHRTNITYSFDVESEPAGF